MKELIGAASLPTFGSARICIAVLVASFSFNMTARSPPPTTGFSPPASAGGNPNSPTLVSRSDLVASGKKPVMNEPCMYIQHCGEPSANIGFPAVPKLVLAIAVRPPRELPSVNRRFSKVAAASRTTSESNGTSLATH